MDVTLTDRSPVTDSPSLGPLKVRARELVLDKGTCGSCKLGAGAIGWTKASTKTARRSTEPVPLMDHRPFLPSFNPPMH